MSEPSPVETKQRITRSSIERSSSPSNSVGRATRSHASTPTLEEGTPTEPQPTTSFMMKRKMGIGTTTPQPPRRSLRSNKLNMDEEPDKFCWICRKDGPVITCQLCPRVFHLKCLGLSSGPKEDWVCVECEKVMRSECEDTRPKALSSVTTDQLILCLQFAIERMKVPNSEVFQVPVDPAMEPEYHKIILHPMDMSQLEKNVKKKMYGSTEAFLADAKWILHNSIIYNGMHNKYTMIAKSVLKMCRNQMTEIETCPDCYLASCTQDLNWFCKPCKLIHPLVWAKLKGYPFWPAKALREVDGQVDCRFFGAHDKAWVPANQVYLLSEEPPAPVKNKKGSGFDEAMVELEKYILNFKTKYGTFTYSTTKELYRSDFGQPSPSDSKKRQIQSPTSDRPEYKRTNSAAADEDTNSEAGFMAEKSVVLEDGMSASSSAPPSLSAATDTTGSQPPSTTNTQPTSQTATVAPCALNSSTPQTASSAAAEATVSRPSPTVTNGQSEKTGPKTVKPGVFTVSEETLKDEAMTSFKVLSDEPVSTVKTDPVVDKIERTLNAVDSDLSSGSQTQESVKAKAAPDNTESQVEQTSADANKSPTKSDKPAADSVSSLPLPNSTVSAEEYTKKLVKTIDACKNQLGLEDDQLNAGEIEESEESEDTSSESETSSDDSRSKRKRKRRSHRASKRQRTESMNEEQLLSEKERVVTDKLLELLSNGLESTIKDIVKQTLAGTLKPAEHNAATESAPASTAVIEAPTANGIESMETQSEDPAKDQVNTGAEENKNPSPVKQSDTVTKCEPLTDNQKQMENKLTPENLSNTEPTVASNEMIEKLQWKHKCEIEAIKHNSELATLEMRKSIELEKERALWRLRKQLEHKFKRIIEETKKKQWCAMCGKEAIFYCCWNTSYCDYPCQQKHWPQHLKTCAQIQKEDGEKKSTQSANQQQPQQQNTNTRPAPSPSATPSSTGAPPPYMPTTTTAAEVPAYQLMAGQVQYMPVHSTAGHVYQAQVPVQAIPMQTNPRGQSNSAGAPLLYPVMQPPNSGQAPPPPQSFMVQQRHPYRLAPKYN